TRESYSGSTHPQTAGNGSLMRLAPIAIRYADDPAEAIRLAAESSRTTHGAATAIDACRYFAGLLVGAIEGWHKEVLLSPMYSPIRTLWQEQPLHPEVAKVASGSFRENE